MKKIFFLLLASATMMACQQKANNEEGATAAETKVFEGTVPAADGPGIKYEVSLESDSSFNVVETYLQAENGEDQSQTYTGKAEGVEVGAEKGLKLTLGEGSTLYVKLVNDSTLRLVNDSLQEAASELNYDLKLK